MRLSLFFHDFASRRLASRSGSQLSFTPNLPLFAGDHGGAVIPVPIPNTEVKGSIAEGSASPGRARVGRRQLFYFMVLRVSPSGQTRFSFFYKSYIPLGEAEPEGRPTGGATSYSPRYAGPLPTLTDPNQLWYNLSRPLVGKSGGGHQKPPKPDLSTGGG